jgi:hypothetical protein
LNPSSLFSSPSPSPSPSPPCHSTHSLPVPSNSLMLATTCFTFATFNLHRRCQSRRPNRGPVRC